MSSRITRTGLRGRRAECAALDRLVASARVGESQVLVLRGEAGIGKTALLEYLETRTSGCRIARAAGVESEMELAYAGLHQLSAPMLDRVERLPVPQRETLRTALGISAGPPPDRFLVGLAVLSLLSEAAGERPLICLIDDEQWFDRASAQALGFVARRLAADPVSLVFASRVPGAELAGLPELVVGGLVEGDARALLDSTLLGPLDERVRDLIIAEAQGNPLALLELPRGLTPARMAGGFGLPSVMGPAGQVEESFQRQLEALPAQTRRLLLLAAADPAGHSSLSWRGAARLGLPVQAATPAMEAELVEVGARVRFRHPLVRSAVYRSASLPDRQQVHAVLAELTDPVADPDRRAWHRAQAAAGPDEEVAVELERSAARAGARGGLAAAAAFLERAAGLTPEPERRAERELATAWVQRDVGMLDQALSMLADATAGPLDPLHYAQVEHLRGQIAFDGQRGRDAARLLLSAARSLEPLDPALARETYLEALAAAMWASGPDAPGDLVQTARIARSAPPAREPARPVDMVLDALATRFTEGFTTAVPPLTRALDAARTLDVGASDVGRVLWLVGNRVAGIIATEVWDFASGRALAERQVRLARDAGALVQLQFALNFLANHELLAGELAEAVALVEEERLIAEVTGNPLVGYSGMLLAALRGRETLAAELVAGTAREAGVRGQGRIVTFADYANAVLNNGLGRHDAARDAVARLFEQDVIGYRTLAAAELAEAASRTGDGERMAALLDWMSERAAATPTDWALGIQARLRALHSEGDDADRLYRESIERLSLTDLRVELARGHLLFGEWLRREGRRTDARQHLRTAYDMLTAMGVDGFAERARQELLATGEKAHKRTMAITKELTVQEFQIARLARDGLSNPEIGTRLFISPRTVEWHLRHVFGKLGISTRRQLRYAELPAAPA
jgi:DNA-binding CsgD family transcriptional regulator